MTGSWLPSKGSEKLHPVNTGSLYEIFVQRAARVLSAPVAFQSEAEEPGIHVSVIDGSSLEGLAEFSAASASELPPEIAELIFGAQAS